jgi:hypothetical protein
MASHVRDQSLANGGSDRGEMSEMAVAATALTAKKT